MVLLLLLLLLLDLLVVLVRLFSFCRFMVLLLLFEDCLEGDVGRFLFSVIIRERRGGVCARFVLLCCLVELSNILYIYQPFAPKSCDFVAC
jgi:hypothetical protein